MDHDDIKRILLTMSSIGKVDYHIGDDFVGFYRGEPPRAYAHGIKSALSRVQDELAPNLFLVTKIFFNILHRRFGDYYIHGFIPMVLRSLYKILFGKAQDGKLHLLSDKDKFVAVSAECLRNKIMLLPQLKKAYVAAQD